MKLEMRWILVAACATSSCQTITEDMPTAPNRSTSSVPVNVQNPIPVVVTQIPIPTTTGPVPFPVPAPVPGSVTVTPRPAPASAPTGGGQPGANAPGGGGGSGPAATSTPVATAQPLPTAQPVPVIQTPTPGAPAQSTNAVASIHAVVYYIICNDKVIPDSKFAEEAAVGCQMRLDATPKDEKGKATTSNGTIVWTYGGNDYPIAVKNPYTPLVTGTGPGEITAFCELDGVRSNTVVFRFR